VRLTEVAGISLGAAAIAFAIFGLTRPPMRPASEPASAAKDSISTAVRRLGPQHDSSANARAAFLQLHQDEIRNTYAVADVISGDSLAVALVRYSIGGSVFHDVRWLRRVGGLWYTSDPPPADSAVQASDTGLATQRERGVRWLREGAPRWW